MDNVICVSGNVTKDVDLRYTATGRGVSSFGLAVNRRFQQNGEWQEETTFLNVIAWSDLGEHCAASLSKGDRVIVTGRIEVRSYDDKDGNKRYVTEIVADDIGPSLKWAEATVERIARSESAGSSGNKGGDAPLPPEEPFVRAAEVTDL